MLAGVWPRPPAVSSSLTISSRAPSYRVLGDEASSLSLCALWTLQRKWSDSWSSMSRCRRRFRCRSNFGFALAAALLATLCAAFATATFVALAVAAFHAPGCGRGLIRIARGCRRCFGCWPAARSCCRKEAGPKFKSEWMSLSVRQHELLKGQDRAVGADAAPVQAAFHANTAGSLRTAEQYDAKTAHGAHTGATWQHAKPGQSA